MKTVKFDGGNVKLIAHRGLSSMETENTIEAFVAAANRNYWGIETDVHVTKDGKFVVFHDDSTERMTGKKLVVEKTSYKKLSKLVMDNNGIKSRIPLFEEYLAVCKKYGKKAVVELKNEFNSEDIKKLIKIIEKVNYIANVLFISFHFDNLIKVRTILPTQDVQFLTGTFSEDLLEKLRKNNFGIDIKYTELNEKNIAELKKKDILINCWTCDKPQKAAVLAALGVNYITTNILQNEK